MEIKIIFSNRVGCFHDYLYMATSSLAFCLLITVGWLHVWLVGWLAGCVWLGLCGLIDSHIMVNENSKGGEDCTAS